MTLKERIESAIAENKLKIDKLSIERDNLEKKQYFNEHLKYAYNRRCAEIHKLIDKNNTYLEVLGWMDEE